MMSRHPGGTPAVLILERLHVAYQLHEYEHDPRSRLGFGMESAIKLGIATDRIFKTLLAEVDERLIVAVVPVSSQLDLKALANTTSTKKAVLADSVTAEKVTGYVVGGISPIGQKRRLPTIIDQSATQHQTILVSGGRRGLSIELAPSDLMTTTDARIAAIGRFAN